eukprot:4572955-Amphidinium_carterae.1
MAVVLTMNTGMFTLSSFGTFLLEQVRENGCMLGLLGSPYHKMSGCPTCLLRKSAQPLADIITAAGAYVFATIARVVCSDS